MPVYISDQNALDLLVEVECWNQDEDGRRQYREDQQRTEAGCFGAFVQAHNALQEPERVEDKFLAINGIPTIGGVSNWNRYFVAHTGEIFFSLRHARPGAEERARTTGFRVR